VDNRVRDLDQIQEHEGDERGRRIGTILLAAAALVGLTFAMGVVVGRAAEPPPEPVDPLAKLDSKTRAKSAAAPAPAQAEPMVPKVDAADLSFPSTLSEDEDRPEVLAALKAAADEEAALAPGQVPDAPGAVNPGAALNAAAPQDVVAVDAALGTTVAAIPTEEVDEQSEVATEELVASIPAAVAAGPGARSLHKTAKHDRMVARALLADSDDGNEPAERGHDGEFTLQVISYDSPEPSRAFAEGLRAKGHAAFVVAADIPDRGRYYRVRIGPFKNRFQADAYRRKFESEEQMNTFVVREKPEEG
jgi:DedD protein